MVSTVFDFAARIQERLGQVSKFRLNKLVYYVQAWSLVHRDRPAFTERIEAWKNGPVVPALWADVRHASGRRLVDARPLNDDDSEIVDQVLFHYGQLTGPKLVDLTHEELPWRQARVGVAPGDNSRNEVSLDSIRTYYQHTWRIAHEDNQAIVSAPAFSGSLDELARHLEE